MIMEVQSQLKNEFATVQQVDYSTVFAEKKQLEDSLTLCMNQYEDRLRRAYENIEQSNQGYEQAQEEMRLNKHKTTDELKVKDQFISNLVEMSNKVKSKVHRVFDGKKKGGQDWLRETLNEIELGVAQIYDLKADSD